MPRKATKDTYGVEMVGGTEVRRLVKAGGMIPPTLSVEEGSYEETQGEAGPLANAGIKQPEPVADQPAEQAPAEPKQRRTRKEKPAVEPGDGLDVG